MKLENILVFVEALGLKNVKVLDNWVMASCPLASKNHPNGSDSHPSFGISIKNDGASVWRCFTCNTEASILEHLLHKLWILFKVYPKKAAGLLCSLEAHENDELEVKIKSSPLVDKWSFLSMREKPYDLPEYIGNFFTPLIESETKTALNLKKYLIQKRQVQPSAIAKYDVRFLDGAEALIFPLYDIKKRIQAFQVRKISERSIFALNRKFFDPIEDGPSFPTPKTHSIFFGMKTFDIKKPTILVEGPIDALSLARIDDFNCLALLTAGITKKQLDALQFVSVVLLGLDSDAAGKQATQKIIQKLRQQNRQVIIGLLDWSLVAGKNGGKAKDANDVKSEKDLLKVINNVIPV